MADFGGYLVELAQSRPSGTVPVSVYSLPNSNTKALLKSIYVANTTDTARTFRIYVDQDGTTYDQSTALFYDIDIAANTTIQIEDDIGIPLSSTAGNIAVRTSEAEALTFTLYGQEKRQ